MRFGRASPEKARSTVRSPSRGFQRGLEKPRSEPPPSREFADRQLPRLHFALPFRIRVGKAGPSAGGANF
jgi:hypothetical protein